MFFQTNYFAVHVTPQPEGSYASFETNIIEENYFKITDGLLSILKPKRFSLILTTSMDDFSLKIHSSPIISTTGYKKLKQYKQNINGKFAVTFENYTKN